MWLCPNCNKENQGKYCERCGTIKPQQSSVYAKTEDREKKEKRNKTIKVICVVAVLITLITATIVVSMAIISNESENNSEKDKKHQVSEDNPESEPYQENEEEPASSSFSEDKEEEDYENTVNEKTDNDLQKDEEAVTYSVYRNNEYNFYCDYPNDFKEVSPRGVNALKTYVSEDGTAEMTIRASVNSDSVSTKDALNEFISIYGGSVTYKSSGDTWYAISIQNGDRVLYRKFFNQNGNLYCMDFAINAADVEKYSPYIEHIEDNFKAY